jgi:hypothetical protein
VDPRAERIAWLPGMYRLTAPPPGIGRDVVNKLRDPVEDKLCYLVVRLANRRLVPGDDVISVMPETARTPALSCYTEWADTFWLLGC